MKLSFPLYCCTIPTLLILLTGCGLTAPHGSDGYARLDSPGVFDTDITMAFSVGPTLLRFAASQVDDEPEIRALLRELDGVRVRIYEIDGDAARVAERLNAMNASLRNQLWEPVVAVKEATECTYVLMKTDEQGVSGLTVLTSDGAEVVIVNVMGDLRPELFAEAMAALEVEVPAIAYPAEESRPDGFDS